MRSIIILVFLLFISAGSAFARTSVHTQSSTTIAAAAKVLDLYQNRTYLLVENMGSAAIYMKFSTTISSTEGISIPAGGNWEMYNPPIDAVYLKASSGTIAYRLVEAGF